MVYQDSWPLAPLGPKVNSKFEILLVKVFSLKQKIKQILPATIEKILSLQKRVGITMGTWKTKAIQADLGIF